VHVPIDIRHATLADVPVIEALIAASARALSASALWGGAGVVRRISSSLEKRRIGAGWRGVGRFAKPCLNEAAEPR
jgi:hypothetical protein